MKKIIILFLSAFALSGLAQDTSNIQIKDLVVIYQNDTINIDTTNFGLPTTYLLLAKIEQISNTKKVYFKFGTANDSNNVFTVVGTVQEDSLLGTYSILYNGRSFPFQSYTASIFIPVQSLGNGTPLIATFYIEDKQNRFSNKIYYTIKE